LFLLLLLLLFSTPAANCAEDELEEFDNQIDHSSQEEKHIE
jgi:hypothetical protein